MVSLTVFFNLRSDPAGAFQFILTYTYTSIYNVIYLPQPKVEPQIFS